MTLPCICMGCGYEGYPVCTLTHAGQKHGAFKPLNPAYLKGHIYCGDVRPRFTRKRFKFEDWLEQVGFGSFKDTCLRAEPAAIGTVRSAKNRVHSGRGTTSSPPQAPQIPFVSNAYCYYFLSPLHSSEKAPGGQRPSLSKTHSF